MIGKKNKKIEVRSPSAFSLIEILVSLAIFTIIISAVITITMSMIATQQRIQSTLFLVQTSQTTIESMSRQIRFGYNYSGNTETEYISSGETLYSNLNDIATRTSSSATSSQNLVNAKNSPFILFESQGGNPNDWSDQNAFCVSGGMLYKITQFQPETDGRKYRASCKSGSPMLPESITVEKISFDVFGDDSENPKNPMVRIKLRLKHELTGSLDLQTTVTQRLVTYF